MRFFCTVVTRSHLFYVRSLAESLRSSGNPEPLVVLVADSPPGEMPAAEAGIEYVGYGSVEGELPPLLRYYFDAFELSNALKPFLISLLFRERAASGVIYLDSDLMVTGSFARVWESFGKASLLMTPHRFTPPALDERFISEVDVVDMGFLNGGFAAWRRSECSDAMLAWMRSRFPVYGFCDRRNGMFVDQKLLPLLLQYFPDDTAVLRDPGLNVAFWNAYERGVSNAGEGRWMVGDRDVVFFHLSGYRLESPGVPCTYLESGMNDFILSRSPWLASVLARYHAILERHAPKSSPPEYPFATFDGIRLTQAFRRLLFVQGRLDRASAAFWKVWITEKLKTFKRSIVRLLGRTPGR